ncbi:MAG: sugar transferase [Actinomycetota bacterium]
MRTLTRAPAPPAIRRRTTHRVKLGSFVALGAVGAGLVGALSLTLAYMLRDGDPFCATGWHLCDRSRPYMQLAPFAFLIFAAVWLRRRPWRARRQTGFVDEFAEAMRDAGLGFAVLIVVTFFFRSGFRYRGLSYSRWIFLIQLVVATIGCIALAAVVKRTLSWLRRRGHNQWNLVVVGEGEGAATVERLVKEHSEMGYNVVGRVAVTDGRRANLQEQLLSMARRERVDEVLLAVSRIDQKEITQIVGVAELVHLDVKAVPELFGLPPTKTSLESLGNLPVLGLLEEPLPGARRVIKRALDLSVGGLSLIVVSPILLVCAAAVRLSSKGPVILRQERVGMDGRPFGMLKFRSMAADADASLHEEFVANHIRRTSEEQLGLPEGRLFKLEDDPRITKVGKVLRRLSFDELPQLFNVLRGEMSLVGPRPALPFEVGLYEDWHRRRLEVRPGMTGPWQVGGRGRLTFDDMVRLDIQYIETWSPLVDVLILLRTVPAMLRKETG